MAALLFNDLFEFWVIIPLPNSRKSDTIVNFEQGERLENYVYNIQYLQYLQDVQFQTLSMIRLVPNEISGFSDRLIKNTVMIIFFTSREIGWVIPSSNFFFRVVFVIEIGIDIKTDKPIVCRYGFECSGRYTRAIDL